ncbi:MAG: phosphotransferase family protein, partial [Rhodospirillaceae bacterium]
RPRLAARCGELLAKLHTIDPTEFSFLEHRPDSVDAVKAFLDRYDFYAEHHPALELGFRWLERNRAADTRKQFLHGDFRCGNLMIGTDDVHAVLDWECAHLGAPMEDVGWLCTRSWRFDRPDLPVGGFGVRKDLYEAYHAAGGDKVDPDAVRYWEIFGLVRWAIYNIMQAYGHVQGFRRSMAFAACGRNTSLVEYDLLMTLAGHYE